MANPSFSMPDELLREFDEVRDELKRQGELDMDAGRSEVIRQIMEEWIGEQEDRLDLESGFWKDEGNSEIQVVAN